VLAQEMPVSFIDTNVDKRAMCTCAPGFAGFTYVLHVKRVPERSRPSYWQVATMPGSRYNDAYRARTGKHP
jgi:hypothetical protein